MTFRGFLTTPLRGAHILMGMSTMGSSARGSGRTDDLLSQPDYSGEWDFSPGTSVLQIPVPQRVDLTIEQREGRFRLERSFVQAGQRHTITLDLQIGGDNEPFVRGDALVFPAIDWDECDLFFTARIAGPDGQSLNEVRYHLDEDGSRLVADERFQSSTTNYENHWVFRKRDS